jgi:hypothetical protein
MIAHKVTQCGENEFRLDCRYAIPCSISMNQPRPANRKWERYLCQKPLEAMLWMRENTPNFKIRAWPGSVIMTIILDDRDSVAFKLRWL